jgi:DNA replication protein DnaC
MEKLSDLFRRKRATRETDPRLPVVKQDNDLPGILSGDWEDEGVVPATPVVRVRPPLRSGPTRQVVPRKPVALHPYPMPRPPRVIENVCPKCRGAGYLRSNVPYGHPNFGKPIACACKEAELKEKQQKELAGRSDILGLHKFKDASFTSFDADVPGVGKAYIAAHRFASDPRGWLVITGPKGCGKTHLAVAIAKERLSFGDTVLMQTVPDLLDNLRSSYKSDTGFEQALSLVQRVDLLVLDDYGAESSTPWAREKLFQAINYRYNDDLPTVITSNLLDLAALAEVDTRIASRMSDAATATFLRMCADDYRPTNGQGD